MSEDRVNGEELQRVIDSFEESAYMIQGKGLSAWQKATLTEAVEEGTMLPEGWWY